MVSFGWCSDWFSVDFLGFGCSIDRLNQGGFQFYPYNILWLFGLALTLLRFAGSCWWGHFGLCGLYNHLEISNQITGMNESMVMSEVPPHVVHPGRLVVVFWTDVSFTSML